MKYKRLTLTEKDEHMLDCLNCPKYETECKLQDCIDIAIDRLSELEDKIENGTLVFKEEIPCKVGDEVYRISVEGVRPGRIIRISVPNIPICIDTWCGDLFIGEIGGTLFFTKDEAEKRFEELRGVK